MFIFSNQMNTLYFHHHILLQEQYIQSLFGLWFEETERQLTNTCLSVLN